MVKNIRHFGITIRNLEQDLYFYKKLLGFEEVKREELEGNYIENLLNIKGIKLTYVKLKLKGTKVLLELWYFPNMNFVEQHSSHFALTVDNLDELITKLNDNKIAFFSPPIENNKVKVCFCRDFSGNIIELVEEIK